MSPSVLGRSKLTTYATRRPAGLCRDRQVLECARALRGQVRQAPRLSRSLGETGCWACLASCRRRQVGQEAPPTARRWNPRTQRVTPAQRACGSDRLRQIPQAFGSVSSWGDGLDPSSTRSAVIGSSGSSRAAALDEEAHVLPPSSIIWRSARPTVDALAWALTARALIQNLLPWTSFTTSAFASWRSQAER